jgi:hypothetical protein
MKDDQKKKSLIFFFFILFSFDEVVLDDDDDDNEQVAYQVLEDTYVFGEEPSQTEDDRRFYEGNIDEGVQQENEMNNNNIWNFDEEAEGTNEVLLTDSVQQQQEINDLIDIFESTILQQQQLNENVNIPLDVTVGQTFSLEQSAQEPQTFDNF